MLQGSLFCQPDKAEFVKEYDGVGPWIFLFIITPMIFFTAGANLYSEPNAGIEIEREREDEREIKKKKF
jgi:hypothetical protein